MSDQGTLLTDRGDNVGQENARVRTPWFITALGALLFLACVTAIGLAGCQGANTPTAGRSATPTPSDAVPQPSPDASIALSPTPTAPAVITLTVWTALDFSPQAEGPAGEAMRQLLATFNETQEDIQVEYVLKKPQGKGGLLDFLLTANFAAPSVLPDVILLEPHALRDAAGAGLVQPLDDLLPPSVQEDLFPFALEAGRFDGQLRGVQFQADVLHLLYNTSKLDTPPLTWTDVLTRPEARYLFPAGGRGGLADDTFLIHYLSTGVSLFDELGQLALDEESMTAVLGYYAAGVQSSVMPTTVLELESAVDAWPIYVEAKVAMTEMIASHYLANRHLLRNTAYAAIPGQQGPASTVSRGWMIALVTTDPYRTAAAIRFLEWWLSSENNTNWNLAAGTLPVRRSAYRRLGEQDAYLAFVADLLETTHAYPLSPDYREVAAAWQIAIQAVITGEQSPQEAAAQVMASLAQ